MYVELGVVVFHCYRQRFLLFLLFNMWAIRCLQMSGKKKTQKKKGRAKDAGADDFDDLVENANDDGCGLSRKYATDIIRYCYLGFSSVFTCAVANNFAQVD